jgi:4-hydroxy-4-methyl-2-oxoglutarate aldolase
MFLMHRAQRSPRKLEENAMAEPAKLTIRREFPRPSPSEIKALEHAPTGWVVDALGRRGALPHWIRPLSEKTRFVGTAMTVRTRPVDNLAPYTALKFANPGDVLVVAVDASDTASILGDLLLGMARNAGIVAAVTDGLVRDIAGINQVGMPVFARALSPNSPFKDGPGEVGLPITLGGVLINAGDVLVGDIDGVVVVPRTQVGAVARELEAIADKEKKMESAVASGAKYPAWLDDVLKSASIRYVD